MFHQNTQDDRKFYPENPSPLMNQNSREFPQGGMSIPGLPQQPEQQGYVSGDTPFPYAYTNGTESYVDQSFAWPPSDHGGSRVPPPPPIPGGGHPFEQQMRQLEWRQNQMEQQLQHLDHRLRQVERRVGIPVPPDPFPGGPR